MTVKVLAEYATLTCKPVLHEHLLKTQLSQAAFDELCELNRQFPANAPLLRLVDRDTLRLNSYVGVLALEDGTQLEILPKTFRDDQASSQEQMKRQRNLLRRMLQTSLDLHSPETTQAMLQLDDLPLSEWIAQAFLLALDRLIKRGLRFDYQRIERREPFVRGQLDLVRQLRQPPGQDHHFHLRYDEFSANRPENRLIKSALERVATESRSPDNQQLADELRFHLYELPCSLNYTDDFSRWQQDRLMAHYQPIRVWVELILGQQMPWALKGEWPGISLLFPMEKVFERYLEAALRKQLPKGFKIKAQDESRYLCDHKHKDQRGLIFRLKPDFVISGHGKRWVLDAKWKLLHATRRDWKYGLKQSDFYQMLAYGVRHLQGEGDLYLIYPKWDGLTQPLEDFNYTVDLRVRVIPFDLDKECLAMNFWDGLVLNLPEIITSRVCETYD